jgi:hypothetical protein
MDFKKILCEGKQRNQLAQYRDHWQAFVSTEVKLLGFIKARDQLSNFPLIKKADAPCS